MSLCTSLTFKLHRRRESTQTRMAPRVLLESCQISSAVSTALREHNERLAMLVVRSAVGTAICSKPLARWMYGDWIPPAES
jgi:hypothetical protein